MYLKLKAITMSHETTESYSYYCTYYSIVVAIYRAAFSSAAHSYQQSIYTPALKQERLLVFLEQH